MLGAGIQAFGDGPDGGREATFDGPLTYPGPAQPWSGHGVLQAKYRRKDIGNKDTQWLRRQIHSELKAWLDPNGRRFNSGRLPEYYILATNVRLSSVPGSGKDSIRTLLLEFVDCLGLKDYALWDGDQLSTYLDAYRGVRENFSDLITPGDLLAKVFDVVDSVLPDSLHSSREPRRQHSTACLAVAEPAPFRKTWRLVPIDSCSPFDLGVHPTLELETESSRLPPYVVRDHDTALRAQLHSAAESGGGSVVVIGDSSAGKSRSLYEACRHVLDGWQILLAEDAAAVREAMEASSEPTLVWLDDTPIPRFLVPGGLTAGDISAWTKARGGTGPNIVVHVLWPDAYQKIDASPTSSVLEPGPTPDPWRPARECLRLATGPRIEVSNSFTDLEARRAADLASATADRRLAAALHDDHYGLTQHLAGAPQVLQHWKLGQVSQPYGAAMLTAAIDLANLGVQVLSSGLLAAAMTSYLTDEQFAEAPPNADEDALQYAKTKLRGGTRALRPLRGSQMGADGGYVLHDYLQQRGGLERHYVPAPPTLWEAIGDHVTDLRLLSRLALAADDRGLTQHALPLLLRTYMIDEECSWRLTYLLLSQGREDRLRELLDEGVGAARWGITWLMIHQDRLDELMSHWGNDDVSEDGWYSLAEVLYDRENEAALRRLSNADCEEGRFYLLQLLEDKCRESDLIDLAEAGDQEAQLSLAAVYARQGKVEKAEEKYDDLIENGDGDVPDEAARALASLLVSAGRGEELREWMIQEEANGYDALRMYYAEFLSHEGRVDELRSLAEGGDSYVVVATFARLLSRLGLLEELRELAARAPAAAGPEFHRALAAADAETELRTLSHKGSARDAHRCLVELLERQGREDEVRQMAHGGDREAQEALIRLLARQDRHAEIAEMAAAGDPSACRYIQSRSPLTVG
ncbi:hypothetical protein Vqi01_49760 [Micromonospora qiuiae]|uniref:Tetratricopeptide repeat protein n=1 Tax=Micromonospora qiuiae TaxID=502268 RepID=A0ABQ4JJV1_9ACTN|nr:hypothetical protein Vqi01_49760 [Micromonospora qiuiae]